MTAAPPACPFEGMAWPPGNGDPGAIHRHPPGAPSCDQPAPEPEPAECAICVPGQCSGPDCPGWLGEPCGCPPGAHDTGDPGGFYVTVQDGRRTGLLLGPYATHCEALDRVAAAKRLARDADPRAHFYAFGTSRILDAGARPAGVLNARYAQDPRKLDRYK